MDEINENDKALKEEFFESVGLAIHGLQHGRLDWLADHIRLSGLQIHPSVAGKLLEVLEQSNSEGLVELVARRRPNLPPRAGDKTAIHVRNYEMACEVARRGGFKRGTLKDACFQVGKQYSLKPQYVLKQVRPWREFALQNLGLDEDEVRLKYERGEVDFLGRPKSTQTSFA